MCDSCRTLRASAVQHSVSVFPSESICVSYHWILWWAIPVTVKCATWESLSHTGVTRLMAHISVCSSHCQGYFTDRFNCNVACFTENTWALHNGNKMKIPLSGTIFIFFDICSTWWHQKHWLLFIKCVSHQKIAWVPDYCSVFYTEN